MRIVFKSLQDPSSRRYVVTAECAFSDMGNQHLSDRVGWFETYGDGDTQHCHARQVPVGMFTDFCASAAQYIADGGPDAVELCRILGNEMRHYAVDADKVRAARGVKYIEGKRRYYEQSTGKVSSAESKRYDTRWQEIPSWMDGGFTTAAALSRMGQGSFLYCAAAYEDLAAVWRTITGEWAPSIDGYFDWLDWGWEQENQAKAAFHALRNFCRAEESRADALRAMECWTGNEENRKRREAEAVA